MLHETKLPILPKPVDLSEYFFTLACSFGNTLEQSHMELGVSDANWSPALLNFWKEIREQGTRHMEGRPAFFALAIPRPQDENQAVRLHISAPFSDDDELQHGTGLQDFDRVMHIVKIAMEDMIEAKLLAPGKHPIEIISEPLSDAGGLNISQLEYASVIVGSALIKGNGHDFFSSYRYWDPRPGRWFGREMEISDAELENPS